jgi:translation initiation factor IF-2
LPDKPEDLQPRAPVVTIMGHVDHGKTSLLDKIRKSNVVATEAGGITQVIRAWRVEHGGRPITFLDTPGHEAFTQMRARGANVTDIAVIVVAADDGVMPQTEEAISHAKAAGVSIVVAINKVDMPSANIRRTEQQLYGLGLVPDTMGGDVQFVQTSAATGKGIDELLDTLSLVAEVKELKANPNKPASGTCLEAYKSEGEGVYATILVQGGTLRKGDVVLCGATYGRIRAMYNDLGQPIEEAGPSVPVRITGLDEVPNADDPFQVVADLSQAREIAEKRKEKMQEAVRVGQRKPVTLETLAEKKIDELKVILKAEARGSIEAIKKELEKLHHEEVRVRILHTAIGGISESDVQLALTSPDDTLILGFNVVPDDRARALADERGIKIHQYDIIYKLTEDVRAALEGKLKPREEVIHLGRAVVREIFKISRVGTIAGCYVTQGTIERSAKVRVIRNGVVVYPPADRTVGLESLKRFKEDTREVREGFECGLKIAGYDDIKVDDVVEAYRIEQVQRTLS